MKTALTSSSPATALVGAALLAEVEARKERANGLYGRELYDSALMHYFNAIWLLKPKRPSYPPVLNEQQPATGAAAAPLLGGWHGVTAGAADVAARESALRVSLHLNVAAVALKKGDPELAREACTQLLDAQKTSAYPKALYRLALAHEQLGDAHAAVKALTRLLAIDSDHLEARSLLGKLKGSSANGEGSTRNDDDSDSSDSGVGASERPPSASALAPAPAPATQPNQVTPAAQVMTSSSRHINQTSDSGADDDASDIDSDDETLAQREARLQRDFEEGERRREQFYARRSAKARARARGDSVEDSDDEGLSAAEQDAKTLAALQAEREGREGGSSAPRSDGMGRFFRIMLTLVSSLMAVFAVAVAYQADSKMGQRTM